MSFTFKIISHLHPQTLNRKRRDIRVATIVLTAAPGDLNFKPLLHDILKLRTFTKSIKLYKTSPSSYVCKSVEWNWQRFISLDILWSECMEGICGRDVKPIGYCNILKTISLNRQDVTLRLPFFSLFLCSHLLSCGLDSRSNALFALPIKSLNSRKKVGDKFLILHWVFVIDCSFLFYSPSFIFIILKGFLSSDSLHYFSIYALLLVLLWWLIGGLQFISKGCRELM